MGNPDLHNYDENDQSHWDEQDLQYNDFGLEEPVYVEFSSDEGVVYEKNIMICTILLILINVIVYLQCLGVDHYTAAGGANYRDVVERGEYGRLLSSMFLHINFEHLCFNMIALFLFGKSVEENLGSFNAFLIYFISGIGSGICSVFIYHALTPDQLLNSVGASGAIYGFMISSILINGKRKGASWVQCVCFIVVCLVLEMIPTQLATVDIFAHLGGALIGFMVTWGILWYQKEWKQEHIVMKASAILLTVVFSLFAVQEAHLGEVSTWSAERIQFIQEMHLEHMPDISYGEALEEFCSDTAWNAFSSKNEKEIVEFVGQYGYQGEKVKMQFTLNMEDASYTINYFSLNGEAQTTETMMDFLGDAFSAYGEKHGIAVDW